MSAHTPGPWIYYTGTQSIGGQFVTKGRSTSVCVLSGPRSWGGGSLRDAERVANAHLIAAAPDMLVALKAAHQFIQKVARAWVHMPGADTVDAAATPDLVRAAIAKAEGR